MSPGGTAGTASREEKKKLTKTSSATNLQAPAMGSKVKPKVSADFNGYASLYDPEN